MIARGLAALAALAALTLAGCAGQVRYDPPSASTGVANSRVIAKPKDQVWATAVPELGRRFFTINNLDRASGLINVSYSGDPEAYVDCGRVNSMVKNARGERTYDFPASRERQQYEVMDMQRGLLLAFDRKMALEGRINLVFEEVGPSQTKVTANTRYVLTRSQTFRTPDGRSGSATDTATFNTGGTGTMGSADNSITCRPTGALEAQLLSTVD